MNINFLFKVPLIISQERLHSSVHFFIKYYCIGDSPNLTEAIQKISDNNYSLLFIELNLYIGKYGNI